MSHSLPHFSLSLFLLKYKTFPFHCFGLWIVNFFFSLSLSFPALFTLVSLFLFVYIKVYKKLFFSVIPFALFFNIRFHPHPHLSPIIFLKCSGEFQTGLSSFFFITFLCSARNLFDYFYDETSKIQTYGVKLL